jgi:arabinofuranosyltransferase
MESGGRGRPPFRRHILSLSTPSVPSFSRTATPGGPPESARLTLAFLIAAFTYIFLANAWLGDDAYITFRVIWNFLHGYGPVFNPGERVQAYTHPLWMLVMTLANAVTGEFFFTALAVSYGFALAAVLQIVRRAGSYAGGAVVFLGLMSSKAFVDYTSSGLENPLSYLLLALFYGRFLWWRAENSLDPARRSEPATEEPLSDSELRRFGLLAALAFVNRMDSVVLYAAPLAWLLWRSARRRDERTLPLLVAFAVPVSAWLLFATFYYGFPLPNTYYAKVATGIPGSLLHEQGLAYLLNSFSHDPITLGAIGIAAGLALRSTLAVKLAAASTLAYVAYTISVGGDFMSGRFFAMPFVVALMIIIRELRGFEHQRAVAVGLVIYNILMPIVPVKTTAAYEAAWPWRSQNGIKDERGHYHSITNVFFFSPFRQLPDHTWMREGLSFRTGPEKVTVQGSIGFYGLMAGPEKHLVDRNALSDPLLARLPVSPQLYFEFYAGHYFRDIPDGYLDSIRTGTNQVRDPMLHDYYDRLLDVVKGPLFSRSRLANIWYLNAGSGRDFARRFQSRRPISLSVRASNERFMSDVGVRDPGPGTLRSTGRAGYLQAGPGIPMKSGHYRARWIGIVDPADGYLGFVDVWDGNRRLARREIHASEADPGRRYIAEVSFVLDAPAEQLDYRLWIHAGRGVSLERVELFSEGAVGR